MANSNVINASRRYTINMLILGKTTQGNFAVLPGMTEPVILGMEMLQRLRLKLDFTQSNPITNSRNEQCCTLISHEKLQQSEKEILEIFLSKELPKFEKITDLCTAGEHEIKMKHVEPLKQKYFPRNPKMQEVINNQINELLRDNLIEPSSSAYSSPLVLVKKKNNTWRMCVDYRQLNEHSIKDAYPIPIISNILSKLKHAQYISTLDLKSGYWQIPIKESSRHLTAFTVPGRGLFQWRVMPFGLHSAPATFQRIVDKMIGPELEHFAIAYLDDIIITSTTFEDHIKHLQQVFNRLREFNLRINLEKCTFCVSELKYLGHVVCEQGIKTDPEKTRAIREMPRPTNIKGVRQFIGLCSWYRNFIQNFADIASPIIKLTRKEVSFHWGPEQQSAFETLKTRLCEETVIACPDFNKHFFLQTDASNEGLGAVLFQTDEDGREKVIAFISRTLQKAEKNYSATEKECLGVFWAVTKLRPYLEGYDFTVLTDHQSLRWLFTINSPTGRLDRWATVLREYSFTIKYKKGKDNVVPDTLSRIPVEEQIVEKPIEDMEDRICILLEKKDWISKRKSEMQINPEKFTDYMEVNGELFRFIPDNSTEESAWKLCVRPELRETVFKENHDDVTAGHLGTRKTIHRIADKYYWPGMYRDIRRMISKCNSCLQFKANQSGAIGFAHSTPTQEPWEVVTMDFVGPLPRSAKGNQMLLVIQDKHTKWAEFIPLRKATTQTLLKAFRENIISRYGYPKVLITDNGSQFASKIFRDFLAESDIRQQFTPPYTPQCNPTERVNRVIKTMIAQYSRQHKEWDALLPELQLAYNSSVHEATNYSPAVLNFGRNPRRPNNIFEKVLDGQSTKKLTDSERLKSLSEIQELVHHTLARTKQDQKRYYNLRRRNTHPKVGERVYVKNHILSSAKANFNAKLAPKYEGPYIVERYISPSVLIVREESGRKRKNVHLNDIKVIQDIAE